MRASSLVAASVFAVAGLIGCGSTTTESPTGGTTTSTTGTGGGGTGGAGGDMTTTTSSGGGAGGMGQGGAGGAGGGAPACEAVPGECGQCLYTECQESYCACYANPECAALGTCLNACDPADPDYQQCTQDCQTQHPGGIADAALVGNCSDQNCQPQCPATGVTLGPCEECLLTNCNDEMDACLANPECQALIECAQMCPQGDQQCQQNCAAMHQGGFQQALGVLNCADMNCNMQCQ